MKSATQPRVSVVTPMYNEAKYIGECIESVLNQSYQNWEYTIVDNCSTDDSLQIAQRYAAQDPRIRIHSNQQFLRAVPNHNVALRQISPASKYCKMVLADDWIFPECLERMVVLAEEHPSAGIVGAYGLKDERVMWTGLAYPTSLISGHEVCRRWFLEDLYVFGSATSILFRADLVRARDPFYNEANFHADSEACVSLLKDCDFAFVHQVLTFSRVRPDSLETISSDINSFTAGKLHELVHYGREFLTAQEYESCLRRVLSNYYASLVGGLLRGRDQKFWDYHKRKLAEAGVGFSRAHLARVAMTKLLGAMLNPKSTAEKAWRIANEVMDRRRSTAATAQPCR